ncbi:MAG: hypothetical protein Q7R79_02895 [bacterium]|nr:hypothetical protein [bacterium]
MTIPAPELLKDTVLPEAVAERPQSEEAPEVVPFLISFARYNKKECDIDGMDHKRAKKTLKTLRDIGVEIYSEEDFIAKLPKLKVSAIEPSGEYRRLYTGLTDFPDAEIREAKVDLDKCRLFFFIVNRLFYVVAVKDSHYNTR